MKPIALFIFVCLILYLPSCKGINTDKDLAENNPVRMILIEFHSSRIEPSMVLFNLVDNIVVFRRVGPKTYYRPTDYPEIEKVTALKTLSFSLDSNDFLFLRDSLLFNDKDTVDQVAYADDGNMTSIVYIHNEKEVYDIDVEMFTTNNQHLLITHLIDSAIKNAPDSTSIAYFKDLKRLY